MKRVSLAVIGLCLLLAGCKRYTPEQWIIPAGYAGWLRLDYGVAGAPPLPLEKGRYIVRVSRSGRLATSTANNPPVRLNEFYFEDSSGRHKIEGFHWPPIEI